MDAEDNGLALQVQGLAQRLEALERENTELRSKVATLEGSGPSGRDEIAENRGSDKQRSGEATLLAFEGQVSRRSLLSKAGAAAVAAMAAGTLMYPRQARADHFAPGINVDWVWAHSDGNNIAVLGQAPAGTGVKGEGGPHGVRGVGSKTGVWGSASETGYEGVYGEHTGSSGYGVVGDGKGDRSAGVLGRNNSAFGYGVWGQGGDGVYGSSNIGGDGTGVKGENTSSFGGYGVRGISQSGTGVLGFSRTDGPGVEGSASTGSKAGVLGRNNSGGTGVKGEGQTGVWGAGAIGVRGDGEVFGVRGESTQAGTSGIYGRNDSGIGAQGNGKTGVLGISSGGGYGGQFEGGKAQLMLKPGRGAGKPTTGTHTKGEIYMDSAGALFVCTAGDGTTVGTWKKVNMKLV